MLLPHTRTRELVVDGRRYFYDLFFSSPLPLGKKKKNDCSPGMTIKIPVYVHHQHCARLLQLCASRFDFSLVGLHTIIIILFYIIALQPSALPLHLGTVQETVFIIKPRAASARRIARRRRSSLLPNIVKTRLPFVVAAGGGPSKRVHIVHIYTRVRPCACIFLFDRVQRVRSIFFPALATENTHKRILTTRCIFFFFFWRRDAAAIAFNSSSPSIAFCHSDVLLHEKKNRSRG